MKKRILNTILLIFITVFTVDLIRAYGHFSERNNGMKDARHKLDELTQEEESLKRKLAGVQTGDYIEKQMREKLNMGREGEIVVLLPTVVPTISPSPTPVLTSIEKWIRLFR